MLRRSLPLTAQATSSLPTAPTTSFAGSIQRARSPRSRGATASDLVTRGTAGQQPCAQFYDPAGLAVDNSGNLFIADSVNNVVREVAPPLYWDPNQTATENAGGSGTWAPGSGAKYWFDPYLGTDVASSNVSTAIFAGAGGTVTLNGSVSPTFLTFASDNYVVVAAAPGDGLNLPTTGSCFNVAGDEAEIRARSTARACYRSMALACSCWAAPTPATGARIWRAARYNWRLAPPWEAAT